MDPHPVALDHATPNRYDAGRPTPAALVSGEVPATDAPHPLSVFDMFRIGIGPSSSHTVGPMRAGLAFTAELAALPQPDRLTIDLYGSLGATGRGHSTDRAVLLGLAGHDPETVSITTVENILPTLVETGSLTLPSGARPRLDLAADIRFLPAQILPYHVNALTITAWEAPHDAVDRTTPIETPAVPPRPVAPEPTVTNAEPDSPQQHTPPRTEHDPAIILQRTYYSVGGGFVMVQTNDDPDHPEVASLATGHTGVGIDVPAPHPFSSARQLLAACDTSGLSIADLVRANEEAVRPRPTLDHYLDRIADTMFDCVDAGTSAQGILPGGLDVPRRAKALAAKLADRASNAPERPAPADHPSDRSAPAATGPRWASTPDDPMRAMDWVNLFALAVNEENAAGHRIVTAPTNGAAGVIPAVLGYLVSYCPEAGSACAHGPCLDNAGAAPLARLRVSSDRSLCTSVHLDAISTASSPESTSKSTLVHTPEDAHTTRRRAVHQFLLAATAIGGLIKTNASIAGAEVGCQGEVGSASAMAAAGLAQALGGTPEQVENAAEIAMEHSLGLTCDPVAGLVQIPCIERNAIAAVKAINAARMALWGDGRHTVSLDVVIETMRQTGNDMLSKYKETSEGGLAVNVVEC
ncbi:L-serine ammonia-lyase, iron-sulfur-dependent, subunit alpha [Actinomyces sp. B33]|uniref:L-serine ammonia-lyase, iron-sulfur-dependent, subunit alpha n=1 Tax=Actinomyces sp. B33 TaxID=2942131 RepID=UPI0023406183|nr:L-serine ammonia-lyase, iron-sulfur-dependent, subunit alpha [Actinomyces sp. B33]MDC4233913.1 L-serine ammonia-lyase, iron-sulfur-dependent, subunit alpha [Actinomyces sp. B33]